MGDPAEFNDRIVELGQGHAVEALPRLAAVYERAFAPEGGGEPDIPVSSFEAMFPLHAGRPGFRLVAAARDDGGIDGFAYGFTAFTGSPPDAWYERLVGAVGDDVAGEWIAGQFEIPELAVVPERQRHGLGTRLLDALLEGLPHRRAWLVTAADNEPAVRFYRARDWEFLVEASLGPSVPRLVLGKRLTGTRAVEQTATADRK
jgi:ribosomal protein S18 acetylase RimI-like enzyme